MMNIDNATGILLQKIAAQNLHVARQNHQIDIHFPKQRQLFLFLLLLVFPVMGK